MPQPTTDLARHIETAPLIDTHEHMAKEQAWVEQRADILVDLFSHYVMADFRSAGVDPKAMDRLVSPKAGDIADRFAAARDAWEAVRFTGYGRATSMAAKRLYDIDEITPQTLADAAPTYERFKQPGERLRLMRDTAGCEHIQTDDFVWPCLPDASGPDFFLYDLSWRDFACGEIKPDAIADETGVNVGSLDTLDEAMTALFAKYGPCAVAVKTQHAYARTLHWRERSREDAERALQAVLKDPASVDVPTRLTLGDWCLDRGAALAGEHNLPVKIHTGHYAGNGSMVIDRINAGKLCPLLIRHPGTRFVLMHIAYPYTEELISIVKHFPNCWADLCWAWSINPHEGMRFVRSFLHAAPSNKLFAFGGDTSQPTLSAIYALQARQYLTKALQAEVDDGELTETDAIELAKRLMTGNQRDCFDIEGTREAIHAAMV